MSGDAKVDERLVDDPRVPLVSATGSTRMGRAIAPRVASRFGRSLLELGGNNAMIVTPSADLELAVRAVLFSAVGTCGQRCTSLRRLIAHESVLTARLERAYEQVAVGDPRVAATLVGPLVDRASFDGMQAALVRAKAAGGEVAFGCASSYQAARRAIASVRRWSACRTRPTWSARRPSRRSST